MIDKESTNDLQYLEYIYEGPGVAAICNSNSC